MGRLGWIGKAVARDPRRALHLPNFIKLYWRLFRDPRVSWVPKLVMVAGIAYVVIPVDLLPDWLFPVAGYLDDALVFLLTTRAFIKLCPPNVVREHVMLIDQGS